MLLDYTDVILYISDYLSAFFIMNKTQTGRFHSNVCNFLLTEAVFHSIPHNLFFCFWRSKYGWQSLPLPDATQEEGDIE